MKKLSIMLLSLALCISLCACGSKNGAENSPPPNPPQAADISSAPSGDPAAEPSALPELGAAITLYSGDQTSENIISQEAEIPELSAQAIVDLMSGNDIIAENITVNSFSVDNDNIIHLDMSNEFSSLLGMMGSSGEYIMLGSLVNTFLDAFAADGIIVTIDGQPLETGHNIYDQPLSAFPLDP